MNGCPRIPGVTFDCGVERIDLQVYAANFMHHAWPFSSFSRKFPATRAKIPAWSLRVPRKIHASSDALLRGKIEIFTQDTWKLDLSRRWYCKMDLLCLGLGWVMQATGARFWIDLFHGHTKGLWKFTLLKGATEIDFVLQFSCKKSYFFEGKFDCFLTFFFCQSNQIDFLIEESHWCDETPKPRNSKAKSRARKTESFRPKPNSPTVASPRFLWRSLRPGVTKCMHRTAPYRTR